MKNELYYYNTQEIANCFPISTEARISRSSVVQQITRPLSNYIRLLRNEIQKTHFNKYIRTAIVNHIDVLYQKKLLANTEFRIKSFNQNNIDFYLPIVIYESDNNVYFNVLQPPQNTLRSLWLDTLPTRIENTDIQTTNYKVNTPIAISSFNTSINNTTDELFIFDVINRLSITINNINNFFPNNNIDIFQSANITFYGYDRHWMPQNETLFFDKNETKTTTKEWSALSKIEWSNIDVPSTATLLVSALNFNNTYEFDLLEVYPDSESITNQLASLYYRLDLNNNLLYHSILDFSNTATNNPESIPYLDVYATYLKNTNGDDITVLDLALEPITDFIYILGVDNSSSAGSINTLFIYDKGMEYPNPQLMDQNTPEIPLSIDIDQRCITKDSVLRIRVRRTDNITKIDNYQVSIKRPDDVIEYIDIKETPVGPTGYYTLNSLLEGSYILTLEVNVDGQKLYLQRIIHVPKSIALIQYDLTNLVEDPVGITFDNDNNFWILDNVSGTLTAKQLKLYKDYMVVDIDNKTIYFREKYDNIIIDITGTGFNYSYINNEFTVDI